mmetsp:Transcript_133448/g.372061  ORF Transcript_133448/g.372061 Transcript_133448/m.372061 type:complete len:234 (+) Transcript_133448:1083-1784(+)
MAGELGLSLLLLHFQLAGPEALKAVQEGLVLLHQLLGHAVEAVHLVAPGKERREARAHLPLHAPEDLLRPLLRLPLLSRLLPCRGQVTDELHRAGAALGQRAAVKAGQALPEQLLVLALQRGKLCLEGGDLLPELLGLAHGGPTGLHRPISVAQGVGELLLRPLPLLRHPGQLLTPGTQLLLELSSLLRQGPDLLIEPLLGGNCLLLHGTHGFSRILGDAPLQGDIRLQGLNL